MSLKGFKHSEETRKKMSEVKKGLGNPFSGKHHSKKSLKKMSEIKKGKRHNLYGTHCSEETKQKIRLANTGKKILLSREQRKKRSEAKIGEKNHRWKGGISSINGRIRHSLEYKFWREAIFKRDNWTCVWCGSKKHIEADHIIPFAKIIEKLKIEQGIENLYLKTMDNPLLWDIDNGRTLCKKCHETTATHIKQKKGQSLDWVEL